AILGGASGHARRVRARHHGLGWDTAGIDACSTEHIALDDRDFPYDTRETRGHVRAGLAGADDNRVVGGHDGTAVPAADFVVLMVPSWAEFQRTPSPERAQALDEEAHEGGRVDVDG